MLFITTLTDNQNKVGGTGYILKLLSGQLDESQSIFKNHPEENIPLLISHTLSSISHIIQILIVSTWWSIAAYLTNGL